MIWRSQEGLSAGRGGRGRMGGKVQGFRYILGRHKMDRGRLRTVQTMGKPKKLHAQPMDMN